MFLQMSLTAAAMIALTVLIRFFFREQLPKMTFPLLWLIALVRLLIPISFYTDYSVQGMLNLANEVPVATPAPTLILPHAMPIVSDDTMASMPSPAMTLNDVLLAVWLIGTVVTSTYFIITYWKLHRHLRFALPIKDNAAIDAWLSKHPLARRITILTSETITTPLTTGILRPRIYLPKHMDLADTVQLAYILSHEFYHIKRFDALWKLVATVALCLHWFNPLVWGMCVLANRDLEITCDAWVVKKYGLISKKSYAFALIGMAQKKKALMPFASGFARHAAEERVRSIMKVGRVPFVGVCVAILVVPMLTFVAFATPAQPMVATEVEPEELDEPALVAVDVAEFSIPTMSVPSVSEPLVLEGCQSGWYDGATFGVNSDPTLGHSMGIQAWIEMNGCVEDMTIISYVGDPTSRFYGTNATEMWEVELDGQRYIIASWVSTNPTYPHAYEMRVEVR
ncbi:MAG: M56 family metallopeptidase [Turicibacter sp.]|nr:M56 family metallopeptidase [Turicibacter sp.]